MGIKSFRIQLPGMHCAGGNRRRGRRGFLLGRTVIAFLIAMCMVPLSMECILILSRCTQLPDAMQDEISALQLRRLFLTSYDVIADPLEVSFISQSREMTLRQSGDKVILFPGTQIFFTDVDDCTFSIEENILKIGIERDGEIISKAIAYLP